MHNSVQTGKRPSENAGVSSSWIPFLLLLPLLCIMRHAQRSLLVVCLPTLLMLVSGCESYPQQQGLGLFGRPGYRLLEQQFPYQQEYEKALVEVEQLRAENQRLRQLANQPASRELSPGTPGLDLSPLPPAGVKEVTPGALPGNSLPLLNNPAPGQVEPLPSTDILQPLPSAQLDASPQRTPAIISQAPGDSEWSARRR